MERLARIDLTREELERVARLAGAPMAKGAGVDLHEKKGDLVEAGEPLYTIHAVCGTELDFATQKAGEGGGCTIGPEAVHAQVEFEWQGARRREQR